MYVIEGIHEIELVFFLIKSGRVAEFIIWSAHMFNRLQDICTGIIFYC